MAGGAAAAVALVVNGSGSGLLVGAAQNCSWTGYPGALSAGISEMNR